MDPKKAIYAGTFDPFTNGHADIVKRALKFFDEVRLVIAIPYNKKPHLPMEVRRDILVKLFKDDPKVNVDVWDGLTVEYAKKNGIGNIIRGLRPTGDFESEFQMASMNRRLHSDVDTVFFMTNAKNYYVSSTLVREIFSYDGDITPFVPKLVKEQMIKYRKAFVPGKE